MLTTNALARPDEVQASASMSIRHVANDADEREKGILASEKTRNRNRFRLLGNTERQLKDQLLYCLLRYQHTNFTAEGLKIEGQRKSCIELLTHHEDIPT